MATKRSQSGSRRPAADAAAGDVLAVLLPRSAEPEVLEVQSLLPSATDVVRTKIKDAGKAWNDVIQEVSAVLATSKATISGYDVDSVTVKIGIDAKGNLGVIAVGGTASFEVKFQRRRQPTAD